MVVFDNTNNFNNRIKGILYISMMDIDFLMQKYSNEELKNVIPLDYLESFEKNLKKLENEPNLSIQYYSVLPLGIETEKDEELLKIIKSEVEQGNLFTKKELKEFKLDELKVLIENLMEEDLISIKELYKLRSYMMADFIIEEIGKANKLIESLFLTNTHESAKEIYLNLKHMGLSSEIVESDYFLENKVMKK